MNKTRILAAAILVASFAAMSLSGVALAKGSKCTPMVIDSNPSAKGIVCTKGVTARIGVTHIYAYPDITNIPPYSTLPNAPRVNFRGPAVTLTLRDAKGNYAAYAPVTICFADNTGGNVFYWMPGSSSETLTTPKPTGRWVYVPTSHPSGMDCASSWQLGTYTRN
jgi:hypothetical protein